MNRRPITHDGTCCHRPPERVDLDAAGACITCGGTGWVRRKMYSTGRTWVEDCPTCHGEVMPPQQGQQ